MIVSAGDNKSYTPAPEGTHQAVCCDVLDLGMMDDVFKPGAKKHKVNIVWQIEELRDDGKRFQVYKRYTFSIHEKATLRHDLESWRGKAFTRDEEMGFDIETVIGANCLINVQHRTKDGKTYANVMSVMPLLRGMKPLKALDYKRYEPDVAQVQQQAEKGYQSIIKPPAPDPDADRDFDDDIPFAWCLPFLVPALIGLHLLV